MREIKRKKDTGEAGNGGQFGTTHREESVVDIADPASQGRHAERDEVMENARADIRWWANEDADQFAEAEGEAGRWSADPDQLDQMQADFQDFTAQHWPLISRCAEQAVENDDTESAQAFVSDMGMSMVSDDYGIASDDDDLHEAWRAHPASAWARKFKVLDQERGVVRYVDAPGAALR